jgi:hypothetical protein
VEVTVKVTTQPTIALDRWLSKIPGCEPESDIVWTCRSAALEA